MTEQEFIKNHNISKRKLNYWLKNNWIRGITTLEDGSLYFPSGAIKPYSRRNKKADGVGMYLSLINGISKGYDVFPALYGLHQDRFQFYINELIAKGFIEPITIENITYYMPLPKCNEYNELSPSIAKRRIKSLVDTFAPISESLSSGVANGVTSALIGANT